MFQCRRNYYTTLTFYVYFATSIIKLCDTYVVVVSQRVRGDSLRRILKYKTGIEVNEFVRRIKLIKKINKVYL